MCDKCINGWIKVGENSFVQCACAKGDALRGFTAVVAIANEEQKITEAMAWYERKMGRVT